MLKKYWPLLATIPLFWLAVFIILAVSVSQNRGELVYSLDDTYINLAIAKNLARYGVWGVTRYAFSSSGTSILWPLVLAPAGYLSGGNELAPLVLNIILGSLVLFVSFIFLRNYVESPFILFGTLISVTLAAGLPSLVMSGMEHILQILLSVSCLMLTMNILSNDERKPTRTVVLLLLCSPLITAARPEGAALVLIVSIVMAAKKRYVPAVAMLCLGMAPIVAYGLVSVAKGWYFFPNSILLKSPMPGTLSSKAMVKFLFSGIDKLESNPHMLMLALMSVCSLIFSAAGEDASSVRIRWLNLIFLFLLLFHVQFSLAGIWPFRYEAYIVVLGIETAMISGCYLLPRIRESISMLCRRSPSHYFAAALAAAMILWPFAELSVKSLLHPPRAMHDRFVEHVFAARFADRYYSGSTIAVNDIGAVSFYSDCRILDVYGLASLEPLALRGRPGGFSKDEVFRWAKSKAARIAILQTEWSEIGDVIPAAWIKVAEMQMPRVTGFGNTKIGFFALEPSEKVLLARNLREYGLFLPDSCSLHFFDREGTQGPPDPSNI